MPFLSVLGNPEVVHENEYLSAAYDSLGFTSVDHFLMALGIGAFVLILASSVFRAVTHYALNRFTEMRRHSIAERLLETYLRQPYAFFLDRNSGDMAKNILSEVDQVVGQVLRPGIQMVAYGLVLMALIALLVAVNPVLAFVVTVVLAGLYALIYAGVHSILGRIGGDRVHANQERFVAAGEALGGIKDIKLLGREHAYLQRFRGPSARFASHMATSLTLSQVPTFLIDAVAFGGIIAIALGLLAAQGGVAEGGLGGFLPVLGLYAFAGLRMKPAAQNVYQGIANLRFGAAAVDAFYEDLRRGTDLAELQPHACEAFAAKSEIALRDVHYRYPNANQEALSEVNLSIPVGCSVGLVGTTGAGKTTLIDVLLGLLRPTKGAVTVDGMPVTDENLRAYQKTLGYVPQDIFLTDSSIAANIAFGVPPAQIDYEHVVHCARMAQIHDFIKQEVPEQYETIVGERGVRLSGGQRQRIGIARALYHDPDVLVFDEATSALDTTTERAVMDAIEALHHQKTIILIAHRLSTVRKCDQVVLLEQGYIRAVGSFEEIVKNNERFEQMAASGI